MVIQQLKVTNKSFFGYYPKKIRAKELEIIRSKLKNKSGDFRLLTRIYFGLTIDQERGCWTTDDWSSYRKITVKGNSIGAHRLSYNLLRGPILDGNFICHYCDRKGCINPFHLFQGVQQENVNDYKMKERKPFTQVEKVLQPDGTILYRVRFIKP